MASIRSSSSSSKGRNYSSRLSRRRPSATYSTFRVFQVTDQGHVLMTFGEGLLVDAEMGRHLPRLAALAPADGAVHDAPTAIPAEPRQTAYGLEAALLRQVDDVGLQGRVRSEPGSAHAEAMESTPWILH